MSSSSEENDSVFDKFLGFDPPEPTCLRDVHAAGWWPWAKTHEPMIDYMDD